MNESVFEISVTKNLVSLKFSMDKLSKATQLLNLLKADYPHKKYLENMMKEDAERINKSINKSRVII